MDREKSLGMFFIKIIVPVTLYKTFYQRR